MENRQIVIESLPTDKLDVGHFALRTVPVPAPGDGEILCRTLALTVGAGQRAGLQGSASYAAAPRSGVVMGGTAVARVEASKADGIAVGTLVTCPSGWQDYAVHKAAGVHVVEGGGDPAHHLGVYGTNGLTAYFGLFDLGEPEAGQTVAVSAAAGSVGHLVGQMAKIAGCRTVGDGSLPPPSPGWFAPPGQRPSVAVGGCHASPSGQPGVVRGIGSLRCRFAGLRSALLAQIQDPPAYGGEDRGQLAIGAELFPEVADVVSHRVGADAEFLRYP